LTAVLVRPLVDQSVQTFALTSSLSEIPGILPSLPTLTISAAGHSTGFLAFVTHIPIGNFILVPPFFLHKIIFM
jgi:hypothetical protein